jgi:hypothetical protein
MDRDFAAVADCCPSCFPGDYRAVVPLTVVYVAHDSLFAHYRHPACGYEWDCSWSAASVGWPSEWPAPVRELRNASAAVHEVLAELYRHCPPSTPARARRIMDAIQPAEDRNEEEATG